MTCSRTESIIDELCAAPPRLSLESHEDCHPVFSPLYSQVESPLQLIPRAENFPDQNTVQQIQQVFSHTVNRHLAQVQTLHLSPHGGLTRTVTGLMGLPVEVNQTNQDEVRQLQEEVRQLQEEVGELQEEVGQLNEEVGLYLKQVRLHKKTEKFYRMKYEKLKEKECPVMDSGLEEKIAGHYMMCFPQEWQLDFNGRQEIQIFIRCGARCMVLQVLEDATVFGVKIQILDREGIPTDQQQLVYASQELEDNRMLSDYSIGRDATLHLVFRLCAGMQQPSQSSPAPSLMPNPNPEVGGSMDVDVGEGQESELAPPLNVPPLAMGALAVGTQNERVEERETSFENREGQIVEVHPLSSPRDPAVVIPLLGVPFSPSGGLGNVRAQGQSTAETLEQLYARYHPTAGALLTSPTNVSSLRLTVQSPVFAQQALVLQGGSVQPHPTTASN